MRLLVLALLASPALAADVCPPKAPATAEWNSWTAKIGRRHCVANAVNTRGTVEWQAAGILQASVAGSVEYAVCCFSSVMEKVGPLRLGSRELTIGAQHEGHDPGDVEEDYPDLIEDDAHAKTISIRGTLGDAAHPIRVDILLKFSASKFADQYAFQFVVIDRSADRVEIVWDRLSDLSRRLTPSSQPVAGGKAWVFLTPGKPREAPAVVELKTPSGTVLGRFKFDGFTLSS